MDLTVKGMSLRKLSEMLLGHCVMWAVSRDETENAVQVMLYHKTTAENKPVL